MRHLRRNFYDLMEDVQNHVLEEESMLFPQAEQLLTAEMAELFTEMQAMKRRLMEREIRPLP